eukprot:1039853-Amorphochlora_amoeboformis.AAC.1
MFWYDGSNLERYEGAAAHPLPWRNGTSVHTTQQKHIMSPSPYNGSHQMPWRNGTSINTTPQQHNMSPYNGSTKTTHQVTRQFV